MTRQLPVIKPQPSPKGDPSTQKKKFHRSSTIDGNPHKTRINRMVEARLAKQFQYFRAEFLEHALSIGIPVPLDMAEDKNGKVLTFVNQKGPRYLLNIIHAYPESVHLLRSSLSFLIVLISILTRKMEFALENESNQLGTSNQHVYTWARDALTSIADSSSVAICTNLLRHSHSEAIQELILNLLAQLVSASPEAAAQMMHRPQVNAGGGSSEPQGNHSGNSNPNTPRDGAVSPPLGSGDPDGMTCLSYMFSVVSHNRNRYMVMTSCAEVCLALLKDKSEEVCEAMARTWISRLPPVTAGDALGKKKERYTGSEDQVEGYKSKPKEKNKKIKTLSVLTRKPPTTALPRGTSAKKPIATKKPAPRPKQEEDEHDNPNEWAALKVLLKFLHRFMRYGSGSGSGSGPSTTPRQESGQKSNSRTPFEESDENDSSKGSKSHARFNQPNADKDDIVPHKHKKALYNAHSRVLLVVVELVSNSSAVAKFILSMPGACAILKASCEMHKDSEFGDKVTRCLIKLQGETDSLLKRELTHHHSMSFELTHGKSAKLFNPVSPISRRERAMLSPERCKTAESENQTSLHPFFSNSGGIGGFDSSRQPSARPGSGLRPKSRGSMMFALPTDCFVDDSRPLSRSGTIPISQLFSTEEKKYLQSEEEKRVQSEQKKMQEKDIFEDNVQNGVMEEEYDVDEENVNEDDSWFVNSFDNSGNYDQSEYRKKRPPRIQTGGRSRPASSQRPRSPAEPYNPPESPKRRGLGPHNGGIKAQKDPNESLHRSLFTNLPVMPDMPIRLEAETIINDSNMQHKEQLLERSMTVTSSVVDTAYRDGFYRDGRNNIPISERARRVYVPNMLPFQGDADRHPNLITEEYLEERRNRPKTQSALAERSAKARARSRQGTPVKGTRNSRSFGASTSTRGNQEESFLFQDAFSDYYQGLLPLNGVGEVEPESEFQLFLVQKQQRDGSKRASTAPSTLASQSGEQCDDSMAFEDSTAFEEHSKNIGDASYASSLSKEIREGSQYDGEDSLVSDWHDEKKDIETNPPPNNNNNKKNDRNTGQIVQSVDMLFP